jgi:cell shape-determining protein MreC
MKKRYSHRRNSGWHVAAWPLAATGAVVLLILAFKLILPGTFVAMATPLWKTGTGLDAGVGSVFAGFSSKQTLEAQNTALTSQIASLMNQNQVLTARAQDLTKLLGAQQTTTTAGSMVIAGVLARPPVTAYDTIVVGSGLSEGVSTGAEVFGTGGIPLGTVQSVTAHTAVVSLLSTAGKSTSGWVGEARTPITILGRGAGSFTATLPKALAPTTGDTIYMPGPGAIPIGTVKLVSSDLSSPSVDLQITPFVNLFSLTWVQITRS